MHILNIYKVCYIKTNEMQDQMTRINDTNTIFKYITLNASQATVGSHEYSMKDNTVHRLI